MSILGKSGFKSFSVHHKERKLNEIRFLSMNPALSRHWILRGSKGGRCKIMLILSGLHNIQKFKKMKGPNIASISRG